MATLYCSIRLLSDDEPEERGVKLFTSENWSKEAEAHLIEQIQKLFIHIQPPAKKLTFIIQVRVDNATETGFLLRNKLIKNGNHLKTSNLTERELQIIDLIAEGFTNKEIAQKLYISLETVRSHRKHLLFKTGSKNTAMLIKYYDQYLIGN